MEWAEVYRAERRRASHPSIEEGEEFVARLGAALASARRAWPELDVDEGALAGALARLPTSLEELSERSVAEVALALACADGDPRALRRLEETHLRSARRALATMKLPDDMQQEVLQEVRQKLLVTDGESAPKIVGYAGRGTLSGLLKVTATRTAISMLRKRDREAPGDDAILDRGGAVDPELDFLKERYRSVFRDAFADAVATLEPRERNLLRLHFLRKVTLEALARMYGVHRATIVRHLAGVRRELERKTRKGLETRLATDRREVESIMDLIRSRFDVSVERLLRTSLDG